MTAEQIRENFFHLLITLKFDPGDGSLFHQEMFSSINNKAFEYVFHFIFRTLDRLMADQRFVDCWPCYDRKQSAEFHKICREWMKEICHSHPRSGITVSDYLSFNKPHGDKFYRAALKLVQFVVCENIQRMRHRVHQRPGFTADFTMFDAIRDHRNRHQMMDQNGELAIKKEVTRVTNEYLGVLYEIDHMWDKAQAYAKEIIGHRSELEGKIVQVDEEINTLLGELRMNRIDFGSIGQLNKTLEEKIGEVRDEFTEVTKVWSSISDFVVSKVKTINNIGRILKGEKWETTVIDEKEYRVELSENVLSLLEPGVRKRYVDEKLCPLPFLFPVILKCVDFLNVKLGSLPFPEYKEHCLKLEETIKRLDAQGEHMQRLWVTMNKELMPRLLQTIDAMHAQLCKKEERRNVPVFNYLFPPTPKVSFSASGDQMDDPFSPLLIRTKARDPSSEISLVEERRQPEVDRNLPKKSNATSRTLPGQPNYSAKADLAKENLMQHPADESADVIKVIKTNAVDNSEVGSNAGTQIEAISHPRVSKLQKPGTLVPSFGKQKAAKNATASGTGNAEPNYEWPLSVQEKVRKMRGDVRKPQAQPIIDVQVQASSEMTGGSVARNDQPVLPVKSTSQFQDIGNSIVTPSTTMDKFIDKVVDRLASTRSSESDNSQVMSVSQGNWEDCLADPFSAEFSSTKPKEREPLSLGLATPSLRRLTLAGDSSPSSPKGACAMPLPSGSRDIMANYLFDDSDVMPSDAFFATPPDIFSHTMSEDQGRIPSIMDDDFGDFFNPSIKVKSTPDYNILLNDLPQRRKPAKINLAMDLPKLEELDAETFDDIVLNLNSSAFSNTSTRYSMDNSLFFGPGLVPVPESADGDLEVLLDVIQKADKDVADRTES